jgi:Cytochrome c553
VRTLVFFAAALAAAALPAAGDPVKPGAEAKVGAVCGQCHGLTGESENPSIPRLNGQMPDYLTAQLRAFRDRKRDDAHARSFMWGNARQMDDAAVADLARYFAAQSPAKPQTGGSLAAEGERLYQNGDSSRGVVACQMCHGKAAEGSGAFPRLAGQHATYLRLMLGAFRSGQRQNDTMSAVAKPLTDRQIEALVSYLAND